MLARTIEFILRSKREISSSSLSTLSIRRSLSTTRLQLKSCCFTSVLTFKLCAVILTKPSASKAASIACKFSLEMRLPSENSSRTRSREVLKYASSSVWSLVIDLSSFTSATRVLSTYSTVRTAARYSPSALIRTLLPGSFVICFMRTTVPTS